MENNDFESNRDQRLSALMKDGQYQQALELLQAWHTHEPWNGEVLMRMAVAHWLAGEPAQTLRDLDIFLQLEPNHAEALARRAQALLMLGKRQDAEAALAKAETIDARTPGVLLNRALLLEEDGRYPDAIASLGAYLEHVPHDHLALARRSHLRRQLGEYQQALEDAQACVSMRNDDPESHFAEALAFVTLERGKEALAACDRCLRLKKSFLPALRLKIDLLADMGLLDAAAAALAQLEALDADAPHTWLLRARMAAERGEFEQALEWVNYYLDDCPDEPYGYYRRGMIVLRMEQYARALEDFQEYARLAPKALEAYEQQFLCYLALEQFPQALEVSNTALELQPGNYRLYYNHAFASLLCGMIEPAKQGFHTALALDTANDELLVRIHVALTQHAPPEHRLDWFLKAVARHGDRSPMLKGLLADIYLEHGQHEQALRLAKDILARDEKRLFGYLIGVKALCLLNRYPDALALADTGVQMLPREGRLRIARALVLRDSGQPDAALQELSLAQQLLPDDAEVIRQQGLTYGSAGKISVAVRLLRQAAAMDGDNADSQFWLGYFLVHHRRYHDALHAADRYLALAPAMAAGYLLRGVALRGLKRNAEAEQALTQAFGADASVLERFSADPVIAELITPAVESGLLARLRRAFAGG